MIGSGVEPGQVPQPLSEVDSPLFAGLVLSDDWGKAWWESLGQFDALYIGSPFDGITKTIRMSVSDDEVVVDSSRSYSELRVFGDPMGNSNTQLTLWSISPLALATAHIDLSATQSAYGAPTCRMEMSNSLWEVVISDLGMVLNTIGIDVYNAYIAVWSPGGMQGIIIDDFDTGGAALDTVAMFPYDLTPGNMVPGFRTEDGTLILLDQSMLTTDDVEFALVAHEAVSGDMYIDVATLATAASVATPTGTVISGTVVDTRTINATYYQVQEVAATPGFLVEFTFEGITQTPQVLHFKGRYQGNAAHDVILQVWNYNTVAWEALTGLADDIPNTAADVHYTFTMPGVLAGTWPTHYVSAGQMRVRFNHTTAGIATHNLYVDYIAIQQRSITLTVKGTQYTLIDGMAAGTQDNVTITAASGMATILISGKYRIDGYLCMAGLPTLTVEGHIAINDVIQGRGGFKHTLHDNSAEFTNETYSGFFDLVAGDEIKFKLKGDLPGGWLSINDFAMLIQYIGK